MEVSIAGQDLNQLQVFFTKKWLKNYLATSFSLTNLGWQSMENFTCDGALTLGQKTFSPMKFYWGH
jgi:hypothetical protein